MENKEETLFQIRFHEFLSRRQFVPPLPSDSKVYIKTLSLLDKESCFHEDSKDMRDFKEKKDVRVFMDTKGTRDIRDARDMRDPRDPNNSGTRVFSMKGHHGSYARDTHTYSSSRNVNGNSCLSYNDTRQQQDTKGRWNNPSNYAPGGVHKSYGSRFSHSIESKYRESSSTGNLLSTQSSRYFLNGFKAHPNRNGNSHGMKERKRVGSENSLNRSIIALLNKVSCQNLKTIKGKIIEMCINEDNTEQVVKFVIRKMHTDYSFMNLYVDILHNIPGEFTHITKRCCLTLIANFLLTLPETIDRITQNIVGENNLSNFIKAKKEIYDMNKAICVLILRSFIEMKPLLYLSNVKHLFDQINTDSCSEIYDIFIHIMYDFFVINASIEVRDEAKPMVSMLLEDKSANKDLCSKRTDFKWNDLLDIIQYGTSV